MSCLREERRGTGCPGPGSEEGDAKDWGLAHCYAAPSLCPEPQFPFLCSRDKSSLTDLSSELSPGLGDPDSGRDARGVSPGMGPVDEMSPSSPTQRVGQPGAPRTSRQPAPLWRPCQGPCPAPTSAGHAVRAGALPASGTGGGRVGKLVTPRALCAAFLCLPTLCPGEWELQRVCCVNTSWSPVIEIAEVSGPSRQPPGLGSSSL